MSEENINGETPSNTPPETESVEAKIAQGVSQVDGMVEKVLGLVGDHPWEKWLASVNACVSKFLPAAIALSGVLAFIVGIVTAIRYNMPASVVVACLGILLVTAFSMHLAPKALALSRSFVEKAELEAMRPEYMYINKVIFGLGGLIFAIVQLLQFSAESLAIAAIAAILSLITIIVYSKPAIVGIKADYPKNSVEELVTIVMFPLKVLLVLLTPILGLAVIGGFIYGVITIFDDGLSGSIALLVTAILPLAVPLAVYFAYLLVTFTLEFYRAIVSIPRRLEDIRKTLSDK